MDIQLPLIVFLGTITCFFGVTFGLFLLYLTLKIKSEFRETIRYEIDKNRKMYSFIRKREIASVEEMVEEFEGVGKNYMRFPPLFVKWQSFLKERIDDLKTLEGSGNQVALSDEAKKFFIYDDPSLGDLLRYIYFVYIKREYPSFIES